MAQKTYKSVSYIERMQNAAFRVSPKFQIKVVNQLAITEELDESSNKILKQSKFVPTSLKKFDMYNVSDFALENIISIGATQLLQPCSLHNDILTSSQNIELAVSDFMSKQTISETPQTEN